MIDMLLACLLGQVDGQRRATARLAVDAQFAAGLWLASRQRPKPIRD